MTKVVQKQAELPGIIEQTYKKHWNSIANFQNKIEILKWSETLFE